MENYECDYGQIFGEQVIIDGHQFTMAYDNKSLKGAIELCLYKQKDCTRDVVAYAVGLLDIDALYDLPDWIHI